MSAPDAAETARMTILGVTQVYPPDVASDVQHLVVTAADRAASGCHFTEYAANRGHDDPPVKNPTYA